MMPRRLWVSVTGLLGLSLSAMADPAFVAGDRFVYERTKYDATGAETERSDVTWQVLESTETGHRIQIDELLSGTPTATVWNFDRDNNALSQEIGHCRNVNDPDSGRYRWPMSNDSTWDVAFDVTQVCQYETLETKPQAHCESSAKVVWQGEYEFLTLKLPAIAIERVVACGGPGSGLAGAIAVRWEKELLCPTLGVRCTFEYDWVGLAAGQWTAASLQAFRDDAEHQRYSGRVREVIKDTELK